MLRCVKLDRLLSDGNLPENKRFQNKSIMYLFDRHALFETDSKNDNDTNPFKKFHIINHILWCLLLLRIRIIDPL